MCDYAEGDDCIAVATKHILNQNKLNKIIIISCDKDMVQLHGPRTTIITIDCTFYIYQTLKNLITITMI